MVKAIACYLVVLIHCRFPGTVGTLAAALARFGVPYFFAIAGRFFIANGDFSISYIRKKAIKRLKHIFIWAIGVWFVYTLYSLIWFLIHDYSFMEWIETKFNAFEFSRLLLFTSGQYLYDFSFTFDHMWFMFALIYIYLVTI